LDNPKKKLLIQLTILILSIILIFVILLTPFLFDFFWNQTLRDLLPGAEYFFRVITELGGTQFYFAIFFIIFWAVNKDSAKSLMLVYTTSNFVNYYAKSIISNDRPPQSEWILIGASHLSTPSGHAMSSTVYWGYGAMRLKKLLMCICSIAIIFLVVALWNYYSCFSLDV
jgi:membrane-associated phospholipid phosphatase